MSEDFRTNQLPTTIIKRIVVRDIVVNPSDYLKMSDKDFDKLFSKKEIDGYVGIFADVIDPHSFKFKLRMAPRNTIIGLDVSRVMKSLSLYYPLFSSHLSIPVKPGESVWVISAGLFNDFSPSSDPYPPDHPVAANPDRRSAMGSDEPCSGYWISRIVEPVYADNVNYTHANRSKVAQYAEQQVPGANLASLPMPIFPNGPYTTVDGKLSDPGSLALPDKLNYDVIYKRSSANPKTSREPVPEFSKRPGDTLLQGSNNTLICLGEDRPSVVGKNTSAVYSDEQELPRKSSLAGTIDIVAGRSLKNDEDSVKINEDHMAEVINTRDEKEKESRTWAQGPNGLIIKEPEGDPSFADDLSRIYISMKTDGDKNFGYEDQSLLPNSGNPLVAISSKPYIILKSNETRIISREDGSIRIIKEGSRNGDESSTQAVITLENDGTVMIDAPKIMLGSGADEAVVLGNTLRDFLSELLSQMETNQATFVATGVGPGVLNPAIFTAVTSFKAQLDSILSTTSKVR
jgi:hypothetical protein